jgi:hypothetical protein
MTIALNQTQRSNISYNWALCKRIGIIEYGRSQSKGKIKVLIYIESSVFGVLVLTISELKVKLFALFPKLIGIGRSEAD